MGRGIDLIRNACLDYGSPAPLFDCDSVGFWVKFPFPASVDAEKTSVKTSVEILRLLTANSSMTLAEVAAEIGKTPRAVELATSKLVKEGKLKYVGPQKGGHWEVLT